MKVDFEALRALMNEPTTPEEAEEEICGVYFDPEKDGLPKISDKQNITKNLEKMKKGFSRSFAEVSEVS